MGQKVNITTPENVSPEIFARLKDAFSSFYPHERYVALAFDQQLLRNIAPHLYSTTAAASRVKHEYIIILTIRFLTSLTHQPFACLFWNGTEKKCLADLLHVYINALTDARARVVATVCPSEECFIPVVEHMTQIKDILTHQSPIIFSTQKAKDIVHIFDPPKLLRDIRNLFMQHTVAFNVGTVGKIATWKAIDDWHQLTDHGSSIEECSDIVFPSEIQKLSTTYAAKLFSITVSRELFELSKHYDEHSDSLRSTAQFCTLFNNIFDLFNTSHNPIEKVVSRKPITKYDTVKWDEFLNFLKSMYFLVPKHTEKNKEDVDRKFADDFVDDQILASKQTNNSDKKESKKLLKKERVKENGCGQNLKYTVSKTAKNVIVASKNLKNDTLQEEVNKKDTRGMEKSDLSDIEDAMNVLRLRAHKFPPIHLWTLNVIGLKVFVERLFKLRFKEIITKVLNIDNVQCVFNLIREWNKLKPFPFVYDDVNFLLMDGNIVFMMLQPSKTYILVPDEYPNNSSTTTCTTSTE